MIKCTICGTEKETPRQMHGHLIRWHYDEYKEADFNMKNGLTEGAPDIMSKRPEKKKNEKKNEAPAGFRLLNKMDRSEREAYNIGYRYIDAEEMCYTREEAKEEGWI